MRYLGCYVSSAGGIKNALSRGEELGVNTIMIHPSPPQRWHTKPFDENAIDEFNKYKLTSSVKRVHMHGIYLINLANPDKQKFHLSKLALVHYLNLAERIDSEGVVFHTGSFKDTSPEEGFKRIVKGINWIFENSESSKPLLLEVAAGAGKVVGHKFEDLAKIKEGVTRYGDRVKFCIDTQHMWASGYDVKNELDKIIDKIEKLLGLENVKCVHFNDSKTPLGSNKDRHENIGQGTIGEITMKAILNHKKLKNIDFVMETPAMKDPSEAKKEADKLLEWAK